MTKHTVLYRLNEKRSERRISMEQERLQFIINQLAIQKAQLEVTLIELQFENQKLRQMVAELTQPQEEVERNEESTI
jgi:hypothetical protein